MSSNNIFLKAASGVMALFVMLLCASCVKDKNYNLDSLDNIDPGMTLFSGGLELPLGHTENLTVANLLEREGMGALDSLIKMDSQGNCSICSAGNYSLDEVISQMHLEKLSDINGTYFSKSVEYKMGDIDPEQFKIEGQEFSYESSLIDFDLDDIPMPEFSACESVSAGMDKYLPDDLDIGSRIGRMEHDAGILDISELSARIPSGLPGDTEISVQDAFEALGKTSVALDYQYDVDQSLSLGENASKIQDISNYSLCAGGTLKVELSLVNCPLTKGTVVPDLDLDVSSMFRLAKVDLSTLTLNESNRWKAEKSIAVSRLADNFPEYSSGKLSLKGLADLSGNILISAAKSTPNTVKSLEMSKMQLRAVVSLEGVVLKEMDITLGSGVCCSIPDVDMPLNIGYDLRESISSVEKVYFDEGRKMSLNISAANISGLKTSDGKHISVKPDVEITFPEGIEVKEARDGKITISGEDLYESPIKEEFTLVSFTPVCSEGKLTFEGSVTASVKADVGGSFSSSGLPAGPEDDVLITAKIDCTPGLKDYDVTLNKEKLTREVSESQEFSFELEGLEDFGDFSVTLKGSPAVSIIFDIPETSELDVEARSLVISLPSMMVVDGSAYGTAFDAVKNTLTLSGKLPPSVELPVKSLDVTPSRDGQGNAAVTGTFAVNGVMTVSDTQITRKTFDELKSKNMKFSAAIPSMEASDIELTGDLNKSLDYEGKDIVILDEETLKDLPEEVRSIEEMDLERVNAIIEISFAGLPDLDGGFHLKNTSIHLPDFLYGENDSHTLILDDDIAITDDGKAAVQKAQLTKLKDIDLEGVTQVKGDIKFISSLYSHKPSIDISTLESAITATIKIGVGNGSAAEHPGKIAISKAAVRAGYVMEDSESISLGEVPEELKGEDVNLDLNPQMHLSLTTNFGAPVSGAFVFTPYSGGKALESVTVKGIELPCSEDPGKTLVNRYAIGSSVTPGEGETLIATDLSGLLRTIPDSIVIAMNVSVDSGKDCIIHPSAEYTCDMDYDFEVPISFGSDLKLGVTSTVDIEEDVASYIRMSGGKLCLKGSYASTLPIGLDFTGIFLDSDDKALSEAVTLKIEPSADGETEKCGDFALNVTFKDAAPEGVAKLRAVFNALASPDVVLNGKQYVRLDNLKIQLPAGLTIEEE